MLEGGGVELPFCCSCQNLTSVANLGLTLGVRDELGAE